MECNDAKYYSYSSLETNQAWNHLQLYSTIKVAIREYMKMAKSYTHTQIQSKNNSLPPKRYAERKKE